MARYRYTKGDRVRVTRRNGEVVDGVVRNADINLCTYKNEYSVDYEEDGRTLTMICVPEEAIEKVTAD